MTKDFDFQDADRLDVAVISDTHAKLAPAVADVVAHCDVVIHAGDICGAGVLSELQTLCPAVIAVAGNNDLPALWDAAEREVVGALPAVARLHVPGGTIVIEHGHRFGNKPAHEALREAWPEARLIVYGHTHRQVCDRSSRPWVLNPGAAGFVRNQGGPHCALLRIDANDWRIEPMQFLDRDGEAA